MYILSTIAPSAHNCLLQQLPRILLIYTNACIRITLHELYYLMHMLISISLHDAYIFIWISLHPLYTYACILFTLHELYHLVYILKSISLHDAYIFICISLHPLYTSACIRITIHVLHHTVHIRTSISLCVHMMHTFISIIPPNIYIYPNPPNIYIQMYTYQFSCILLYVAYIYIYMLHIFISISLHSLPTTVPMLLPNPPNTYVQMFMHQFSCIFSACCYIIICCRCPCLYYCTFYPQLFTAVAPVNFPHIYAFRCIRTNLHVFNHIQHIFISISLHIAYIHIYTITPSTPSSSLQYLQHILRMYNICIRIDVHVLYLMMHIFISISLHVAYTHIYIIMSSYISF